jgi:hypothetical protein
MADTSGIRSRPADARDGLLLVGQLRCNACGAVSIVIARVGVVRFETESCDVCGVAAAAVPTWYPASYWPEVERLVWFGEARQQLSLKTLTDEPWQ